VRALLDLATSMRVEVWRGGLREFIVMVSRAERMYTMDSGPAHIAAALGRHTVVFFGPNVPAATAPRGIHVRVVEDVTVACRPCDQHHCTNAVNQACMRSLVARGNLVELA
jgi:heptosyltransferase-1